MSLGVAFLVTGLVLAIFLKPRGPPLPPGPPADPLIGHLRIMPNENDRDAVFYELSRKYGEGSVYYRDQNTYLPKLLLRRSILASCIWQRHRGSQ